MAVEEVVHAREPRGRDAEARAVLHEEAAAEAPAEPEAGEVAERGGAPRDEQHERQVDAALGGDDAAEHDRGLAGGDEPDERAGLEERQRADERVGPGAERVGESVSAPSRSGAWTTPAWTSANSAAPTTPTASSAARWPPARSASAGA